MELIGEPFVEPNVETAEDKPFLMEVNDFESVTGRGVRVSGCIERGSIHLSDSVERVGFGDSAKYVVPLIEVENKALDEAVVGDKVSLTLRGAEKKDFVKGMVLAAPNSISAVKDFRADISFLDSSTSGHEAPYQNNSRLLFYFRSINLNGLIQFPDGRSEVKPGEVATVDVKLVNSIAIEKGLQFTIREKGKVIATGKVVDTLNKQSCTIGTIARSYHDHSALTAAIFKTVKSKGYTLVKNAEKNKSVYSTANRNYHHIYCSDWRTYLKYIATGGTPVDGLIIDVDASKFDAGYAQEQILLAQKIGVKNIVVFLDRLSRVKDSRELDQAEKEIRGLLSQYGFKNTQFVAGDSLALAAGGKTSFQKHIMQLMDACDRDIPSSVAARSKPFRMSVDDVFSVNGGTCVSGCIERGVVYENDSVECVGLGETAKYSVFGIEMFNNKITEAQVGDNVSFGLSNADVDKIKRGMVIAAPGSATAYSEFEADICTLTKAEGWSHNPIVTGDRVQFSLNNAEITGAVVLSQDVKSVYADKCVKIYVKLVQPVALNALQGFTIRHQGRVLGYGIVRQTLKDGSVRAIGKYAFDDNIPLAILDEYDRILGGISAARPLIFFPVRLDTSFRYKDPDNHKQKQLRVRIIPDEIMLNYKKNAKLTKEEVYDGKFFWIQWFIASGCKKREKEAWETLCTKYPSYKAAWICNELRPVKFEEIREGKDYFYRRPYASFGNGIVDEVFGKKKVIKTSDNDGNELSGLEYIENGCNEIYRILSEIRGNIEKFDIPETETVSESENRLVETGFENYIRTGLGQIHSFIFEVESLLMPCKAIVDYLYDMVRDTLLYLQKQLVAIDAIYSKYDYLKNARPLELWDADYSILESLNQKVSQLLTSLEGRYTRLSDMVDSYLEKDKIQFPKVEIREKDSPIVPICSCLPEKFILVAEVANAKKDMIFAESKLVKADEIQMAFDSSQSVDTFDANGELEMPPKMKWLTDYEAAEKNGMAITVDLDDNVEELRYIYVFGVQAKHDTSTMRELFYGHNYVNSNMRILNAGVSTNLVEKEYVDEEDYLKDTRYRLEVEDYKKFPKIYATIKEIRAQKKENYAELKSSLDDLLKECKKASISSENLNIIAETIGKIKKADKGDYTEEFNTLEKCINTVKDKDIRDSLLASKNKYNILFERFFDISDYDARKIAYLLKGSTNSSCYESDLLNGWARVVGSDSRQDYYTKVAYRTIWDYFEKNFGWKILPPDAAEKKSFLKEFFINHVRARGNMAAIRVEDMPYGILPMSDFVQIGKIFRRNPVDKNMRSLLKVLIRLANMWRKLRNSKAQWSEVLVGTKVQKKYLEMAGQTPYSISEECTGRVFIDSLFNPSNLKINKTNIGNSKNADIGQLGIIKYLGEDFFKSIPIADVFDSDEAAISKEIENVTNKVVDALRLQMYPSMRLEQLSSKDREAIEKNADIYVSEFLDLFTHRLDAWFLGIIDYWFHKKIRTVDSGFVGAFGWSFNLKHDHSKDKQAENRDDIIRDLELKGVKKNELIFNAPESAHFVMAPSIQHAMTAAVLRSSFLKAKVKNKLVDSQICVNLSSTRVRQALRLVDGVKSGMALSIILGTDLERYLHEANDVYGVEMDAYIYDLRKQFPQLTQIKAEDERANDYDMQTINGEALLNSFMDKWAWSCPVHKWLESTYINDVTECKNGHTDKIVLSWLLEFCSGFKKDKERDVFFTIIERLMDSYDALNDLLLSEGVHRLIMGDKSSYYAISNFLANGSGSLPDMEILNIPSERVVVSHKAGVLLPQNVESADKVMCHAEPSLNAWIESQLGGMESILFFVQKGKEESREVIPCSLAELNISGIEYMYLSAFDKSFHAYLEARYREYKSCYTDDITILDSAIDAGYEYKGEQISIDDNKLRLESLKGLVARGRAMKSTDWCSPKCEDVAEDQLVDFDDLKQRLSLSLANIEYLKKNLEDWLRITKYDIVFSNAVESSKRTNAIDDSLVADGYKYLCDCFESGMINCFNEYNSSAFMGSVTQTSDVLEYEKICGAQKDLGQDVYNAYNDLCERVKAAQAAIASSTSVESYVSALQAITLSNFKVCYKFKTALFEGGFKEPLSKGVEFYENIGDEFAFSQWQDEISEVREGMKLMHQLNMSQLALDHELDSVAILQTSVPDGADCRDFKMNYENWLGAAVDSESKLRDADSLVLYNSSAHTTDKNGDFSGFVFDSWIEYIPYKKHDAGIAFHNDWPDNEAPQSLLVAWHPRLPVLKNKLDGYWDLATLLKIMRTTRFMMMNRAVEPDHIYGDKVLSNIFPLTPRTEFEFEFKNER
ncbi:EF-Tu/IF-2/RF-3 family GTPase [Fibrobacter sp. UWB12]|uniref:EF-Tu C-terminal domain-related protein n=1 Tax=Fibrobacter sp. UWB12 TaxID=1896203 RepID=UPI00352F8A00